MEHKHALPQDFGTPGCLGGKALAHAVCELPPCRVVQTCCVHPLALPPLLMLHASAIPVHQSASQFCQCARPAPALLVACAEAGSALASRRFLCCSVPLTVHEDEADGPEAPSDSAVSIAQGLHRASPASQASSLDEPVHADDHRWGT